MTDSELLPVSDGGTVITDANGYRLSCLSSKQKVATVQAINQSTLFNVLISFGGIRLTLAPGASQAFTAPVGAYLVTEYNFEFEAIAGAAPGSRRLVLATQKYMKP